MWRGRQQRKGREEMGGAEREACKDFLAGLQSFVLYYWDLR